MLPLHMGMIVLQVALRNPGWFCDQNPGISWLEMESIYAAKMFITCMTGFSKPKQCSNTSAKRWKTWGRCLGGCGKGWFKGEYLYSIYS